MVPYHSSEWLRFLLSGVRAVAHFGLDGRGGWALLAHFEI